MASLDRIHGRPRSHEVDQVGMKPWWRELSDPEIVARLIQRGVPDMVATEWVRWRETTFGLEITRILGDE